MARIEKYQNLESGIDDLPEELLVTEKNSEKKSGHGWRNWLGGFFLLIILGLLGFVVYCLSASGLVTIPLASDWFYKTPTPIHQVAVGPPLETYISETFGTILTARLQSGGGNLADKKVEISLPESSITNSFRSALLDSGINWFDINNSQIAIDSQKGLEIFLPLANQTNNNAIKIFLKLGADQGLVNLQSVKLTCGNLILPEWFTKILLVPILDQGLNSVNQEIGRYILVKEVSNQNGSLDIVGELVVEIMKIK